MVPPTSRLANAAALPPLQNPNPKTMQINLTGFLNAKNAMRFMSELWELLTSAQDNIAGIPAAFLEQKKEEIKKRQVHIPVPMPPTLKEGGK